MGHVGSRDYAFHDLWREWKAQPAGSPAARRGAKALLGMKEGMISAFANEFMQRSNYYLESMREDVLQAARIGFLTAIRDWDPEKGSISTIAYFRMRQEIQETVKHVTPITRTRYADLPKRVQDEQAKVYAQTGEWPEADALPGMGVTAAAARRARMAQAVFGQLTENHRDLFEELPEDAEKVMQLRELLESVEDAIEYARVDPVKFWAGDEPSVNTVKALLRMEGIIE
jgi:DNA-directed RNA polymerase specialized sigma subunit